MAELDEFTRAYIQTALWSSTDDDGTPLDESYSQDDLAEETLTRMIADCAKFQKDNIEWIAFDNRVTFPHRHSTHEYAGHDFWLTRNRHGAGFWDGDWTEEAGKVLTDAAHAFGEVSLYVGDDGWLYDFPG